MFYVSLFLYEMKRTHGNSQKENLSISRPVLLNYRKMLRYCGILSLKMPLSPKSMDRPIALSMMLAMMDSETD